MSYNKNTPIKEWVCDIRLCNSGRLRTSKGVDVTDKYKKLGIDRKIIKQYGGQEMLDFYLQKEKDRQSDQ